MPERYRPPEQLSLPTVEQVDLALPRQGTIFESPRAVLHSSESEEWYTPAEYTAAVHTLMGSIDLDPASCETANRVVRARTFYTKEQDGLRYPWLGRVFLNPPYGKVGGRSNQDLWSARLLAEYREGRVEEAVLLVNAATDTAWFQRLWAYPICFVKGRIPFWRPEGSAESPTHPSAFVYLGQDNERFRDLFREFGTVVRRW